MIPETTQTPDGWRFIWTDTAPPVQVELTRHPERGATEADATVWIADGEVWGQVSAPTRLDILQPGSRSQLVRHLQGRRVRGVLWADLIEQACTLALTQMRAVRTGVPQTARAMDLMHKHLEPPRNVIPGVVMEGLWILAGAPKIGKSWAILNWLLAVCYGGRAMGTIPVESGGGLYLALEDSEIRLQNRIRAIIGDEAPPATFEYATEWPALALGGTDDLDRWLTAHPGTRLVAIDTLAKAAGRTENTGNSRLYEQDYHSLAGLQSLAAKHHIAIVVLHHRRKGGADDIVETITGTMGLSGAADGLIVLDRKRQSNIATMHIISRDLPADQQLALEWDDSLHQWLLKGDAETANAESASSAVLDWLLDAGEPQNARDIESVTGLPGGTIRRVLVGLVRLGKVARVGRGMYAATVDARDTAAPVARPTPGASKDFVPEVMPNQKFARGEQVSKSGGFEYENAAFDLLAPAVNEQVFEPNTNGTEDDAHLLGASKNLDDTPLCPACGRPRGPTDFCANCRDRLCQVCGHETGSVMRARCLRCAMKGSET